MRIIDIALKDLLQIVRDWKSAMFLVVMPILFTLFFGVVLGPVFADDANADPRLPLAVINHDGSDSLSAGLLALMADSDVIRPVTLETSEAAEAVTQVADGKVVAVVTIPAGYGVQLLADEPASLDVVVDQSVAAGQTAVTALETITNRLLGAVETAHISAETFAAREGFATEGARQAYLAEAVMMAIAAWEAPPLTVAVSRAVGAATATSTTGAASALSAGVTEKDASNGFVQSSPGMIVQFAIFGLITAAMVLVLERKSGSLQRLLTTPTRPFQIVGGHVLAMFVVIFLQQVLLVSAGQFLFGVDYLRQPLAVLLLMVTLALWAASLGLLISAISRGEEQVIVLSLIAMFLFAALGGAWFPLEVTGQTFATIGHLLPTAWAMDGFQNIVLRGLGFESVVGPAGVLLGYTAVFFVLAVWRFRFES